MDTSKSWYHRCYQASTLIGIIFVFFPTGIRWVWGNLTVYLNSYLYARGGHKSEDINTPWLFPCYTLAWALGIFTCEFLLKQFSQRVIVTLGIVWFNLGIYMSYVAVHANSILFLNLTMGAMAAFGVGILETIVILIIVDWFPKRRGVVISLVFSGVVFGSITMNVLATIYINPLNLKPTLVVGSGKLFTQWSVLNRSPTFLLVMAVTNSACQVIGLILIRFRDRQEDLEIKCLATMLCQKSSGNPPKEESSSESPDDCVQVDQTAIEEGAVRDRIIQERDGEYVSLKPQEVLLTPSFYALYLGYITTEIAKIWLFNYYKTFGLVFFQDDHFMTNLGAMMAFFAGITRLVWGWSVDWFGAGNTVIASSLSTSLVTALYYFTPLVSRWLFLVSTLLYATAINGFSVVVSAALVRLYGKDNFSLNYGLMSTACLTGSLVSPTLFHGVLFLGGWYILLLTVSALNGLATISEVVLLSKSKRT